MNDKTLIERLEEQLESLVLETIQAGDYRKSFFHIGSPSKLMRDEIGKLLPRGMAEGIEDETKSAQQKGEFEWIEETY